MAQRWTLRYHVIRRMEERGITLDEIERVLANPDVSYPDWKGNDVRIAETAPGRRIKVVVDMRCDPPQIITTGVRGVWD